MLVGVGTASVDAEAIELMARACRSRAGRRRGPRPGRGRRPGGRAPGELGLSRPGPTGGRADRGARATTHLVELGIPQQSLINDALAAILTGASDVAVVVGGEAKRWARDRERAGLPAETAQPGAVARRRAPARPAPCWSRWRWPTGCGTPSSSTP